MLHTRHLTPFRKRLLLGVVLTGALVAATLWAHQRTHLSESERDARAREEMEAFKREVMQKRAISRCKPAEGSPTVERVLRNPSGGPDQRCTCDSAGCCICY